MSHDVENPDSSGDLPRASGKRRIETQIHRRKKVKTVFPLHAEWDAGSGRPSPRLRMPQGRMKK